MGHGFGSILRGAPAVIAAALASLLAVGCGKSGNSGAAKSVRPTSRAAKKAALATAATGLTDMERRVPHYFGPFPNWANSPFTLGDATVEITGDGSGATATAEVGANGAVTAITVTNPGSGYTSATVAITGSGTGAAATANIVASSGVTAIALTAPGAGYTSPTVTITGGGATTGATATAFGGVDAVTVSDGGSGYTVPIVQFDMPDGPDGVIATAHATLDTATGTVTGVVVDNPGSGYTSAPNVKILNGTQYDPIAGATLATATATLSLQSIGVDTLGAGYTSSPTVAITDAGGSGTGAAATATAASGGIESITVDAPGSGYITGGGIQKFVDTLPPLGCATTNNLGQCIPVAVPDQTTFAGADYYEIAVVEFSEQMHSNLPPTKLRGYVQLSTATVPGKQIALTYPDGTPILKNDGTPALAVENPHYLGPTIVAQRNRAVRITFYNLLPKGAKGDLFLPVDSTMMGSGMGMMTDPYDPTPVPDGTVFDPVRNPMCTGLMYMDGAFMTHAKDLAACFADSRATLHLHGGNTPWISDGTPHQWITPASEATAWPQGVSVASVPDMIGAARPAGVPDCSGPNDGCQTFYYTNQQSARLMFYHDHSWGITRLNVYAGEAAGYVIEDPTEKKLVSSGTIPGPDATIPLIIQDRTFVPQQAQLDQQDPTWDAARWGGYGNLWYHHVYMPAQNPGDPSGMSAYGRWMYGPWFWPPASDTKYGPIANPYFDPNCKLDDPTTWQYQTDPFCEPAQIPGTPNISAGMEQFNDTPIVNGTAYPKLTVEPKAYRIRILNAANDRFFNLSWYVADSTGTEVALNPAELAAAQTDPTVFPTPDTTKSPAGPDWIQIGSEGGFLPSPVVIPAHPVTWIMDPTRFDVGNVDQHSLVVAPAERADVIVDFSKVAPGTTLILYNDAPAAYPARVPSYDYYTGAPDLSPVGAPKILPGYGPNTRTIMQVTVNANGTVTPFNLTKLRSAFTHKVDGSGVFEDGQHPIIVGQAAYNSAYGASFTTSGYCPPGATNKCDGYARINQQGGDPFTFDTLRGTKIAVNLQPKAIHDEMNSSTFDEFGRMTANLGVESVPATPGLTNVNLYQYVSPPTEIIDTTLLPKVQFDANGAEVKVTPISVGTDGTQIWKFTHNGVDTHPIHFHAYDVQVLNRVTWDNIVIPPDANELGWKDTVRMSPLEDTIVALRPVIPNLPFQVPNSVRPLDPMKPTVELNQTPDLNSPATIGSATLNGNTATQIPPSAPNGQPIDIYNHLVNFGGEYVMHCHILSHEEMDMMRPVVLAYQPVAPTDLTFARATNGSGYTLTWTDNSANETGWVVEKYNPTTSTWQLVKELPTTTAATYGLTVQVSYTDANAKGNDQYRVKAVNLVGDPWDYTVTGAPAGTGFPTVTTSSTYLEATIGSATAAFVPSDFNGDGTTDILWHNTSGVTYLYTMNGPSILAASWVTTLPTEWIVAQVADFTGDRKADIVWVNAAGDYYLYAMNGSAVTANTWLTSLDPTQWKLAGAGDFDGDGKADLLWRQITGAGAVYVQFMNGATITATTWVTNVDTQWQVERVADFDGDGKADILWKNAAGTYYVFRMNGAAVTAYEWVGDIDPAQWIVGGTGDFDGDGKADILWRNTAGAGAIYIYFMNGGTPLAVEWVGNLDPLWNVARVGDFNGDGKADILWRHSLTGSTYLYTMNGSTVTANTWVTDVSTDWSIVP